MSRCEFPRSLRKTVFLVYHPPMAMSRHYSLLDVFSIATGAMISAGLFVLPAIAFSKVGAALIVAYAIAAVLVVPAMLAIAELATAMPKNGGIYFFVERSIGPLAGTVAGLANWFAHSLKATFALIGVGGLVTLVVPGLGDFGVRAVAIACCAIITVLNLRSAAHAGRFQNVAILCIVGVLVVFVIVGVSAIDVTRYEPFMPFGPLSLLYCVGLVFVSFGGLGKVADVAGEVRAPSKNIPRGLFLAFGVVTVLYVSVTFITIGTVETTVLANSLAPLSKSALTTMGLPGKVLLSLCALLAFISAANAGILAASRTPMAMSRDGLLPEVFSRAHKRFGTPYVSILCTAALMVVVLLLLSIYDLIKMASTMLIILFILVNLAVIIMRKSGIQNYRPKFRMPWCPWLQVAAIVVYSVLIATMGTKALVLTQTFVLLAGVWYIGYVESRIDRESAFVYLVKRVADEHLAPRAALEDELRHIALERDGVALDRFDHLVSEAEIFDIKESISYTELFRKIAAFLAPKVGIDEGTLLERFLQRERESSTIVHPGLAIPHVVIDQGENLFEIILVRCLPGIRFDEIHIPVTTCFVLVGSPDQRNYHLKALMNVAHIVQESEFKERWESAPDIEHLRDLVLLSGRKREGKKS